MPDAPRFVVEGKNDGLLVHASGELDLAVRDILRETLASLSGVVVVDLSQVTFLDSSVIGAFVGARKRLVADGGDLRLRNPHDVPRRALEAVGLADWIDD